MRSTLRVATDSLRQDREPLAWRLSSSICPSVVAVAWRSHSAAPSWAPPLQMKRWLPRDRHTLGRARRRQSILTTHQANLSCGSWTNHWESWLRAEPRQRHRLHLRRRLGQAQGSSHLSPVTMDRELARQWLEEMPAAGIEGQRGGTALCGSPDGRQPWAAVTSWVSN